MTVGKDLRPNHNLVRGKEVDDVIASHHMEQLNLLRATTQRIVSSNVEDLPRLVGYLSTSLSNCSITLDEKQAQKTDLPLLQHKLKTRISSLLQDRSVAGRLSAATLIKPLIEVVFTFDSGVLEPWARALIGHLNKPDPVEVKRVYILSISRIFVKCQPFPALVREVVSPLLPAFLTACLKIIRPTTSKLGEKDIVTTNALLPTFLSNCCHLVHNFPTTFRPFVSRIKPICLSLLDDYCEAQLKDLAIQLLSLLPLCAPKDGPQREWQQNVSQILQSSHEALDLVFRAVAEEWTSNNPSYSSSSPKQDFSKQPSSKSSDLFGLGSWSGVSAGMQRVKTYLSWLRGCLETCVPCAVVELGTILDLMTRVNSVTASSEKRQDGVRFKSTAGKEEKEQLRASLPDLHVESLDLLRTLLIVFNQAILPLLPTIMSQVFDIFDAECWHRRVREHVFSITSIAFRLGSNGALHSDPQNLQAVCRAACEDLLAFGHDSGSTAQNGRSVQQSPLTRIADDGSSPNPRRISQSRNLLLAALECLPSSAIPHAVRAEMDRVAILTNDIEAMQASVMNPPSGPTGQRNNPSLYPFFSRAAGPVNSTFEALLRPRLPSLPMIEERSWESMANGGTELSNSMEMGGFGGSAVTQIEAPLATAMQEELLGTTELDTNREVQVGGNGVSFEEQIQTGKRDFAMMQETTIEVSKADGTGVAESIKKPRVHIDSRPPIDDDLMIEEVKSATTDDTHQPASPRAGLSHEISSEVVDVKENLGITGIDIVNSRVGTQKDFKDVSHAGNGEGSSDESEIPTIDATWSTDEDEDEDEVMS